MGEQIEVPIVQQMDDETFIKHLEKRHADECKFEDTPIARQAVDAWLGSYEAFHDRLHQIAAPGQYDHVHVEFEEEDDE